MADMVQKCDLQVGIAGFHQRILKKVPTTCGPNQRPNMSVSVRIRATPAILNTKGIALKVKQPTTCLPHLVGAKVIAETLDCTAKHVYCLAAANQIPHHRFMGSVRFDPIKILAWLEEHEIAA